jgi:hypothetical protein
VFDGLVLTTHSRATGRTPRLRMGFHGRSSRTIFSDVYPNACHEIWTPMAPVVSLHTSTVRMTLDMHYYDTVANDFNI